MPRLVDRILPETLAGLPAVWLTGARGAGKTTTARRYAVSTAQLNRPGDNASFIADPDEALSRMPEPTLLDEWQDVPSVLGAVKRAVDLDPRSGRFLLTGSVRGEVMDTWPATGRVVKVPVFPLTRRELSGRADGDLFVDRATTPNPDLFPPAEPASVFDYVGWAAEGGLPDAVLHRSGRQRRQWLRTYLDQLVTTDARLAGGKPDRRRFATYTEALAINSAGVVDEVTLQDAARISRVTAHSYQDLLEALFFCEQVPAWWSDRLTRLTALPKRYLIDTSLMAVLLRADEATMAKDANLLGRILDTFVAMQLRPELAVAAAEPQMYHLRTKAGEHEVDLLLEYPDRTVVGIEIKATAGPSLSDAKHLVWLRERLGDRFLSGFVLHTGPHTFRLSEKIIAAPISTIWQ